MTGRVRLDVDVVKVPPIKFVRILGGKGDVPCLVIVGSNNEENILGLFVPDGRFWVFVANFRRNPLLLGNTNLFSASNKVFTVKSPKIQQFLSHRDSKEQVGGT